IMLKIFLALMAFAICLNQVKAMAYNETDLEAYITKYGKLPIATCDKAATEAEHYATCGCPYVWGGTDCSCGGHGGMDCSGIVYRSYNDAGYHGIGRTTYNQIAQGSSCSSKCHPTDTSGCTTGDLFFYCFETPCPSHVVMYIGKGKAAECPHTGENCHIITPYSESYYGCRSFC
ncbi:hypothetical protein SAMD00019534_075220, partial [Acytostelium subglobosum LB1]|uniref:hypothetical protein n=1 Tax=Acytostelium subglobosum LB1 TaxID=1410327 RepID=UPI00064486F1